MSNYLERGHMKRGVPTVNTSAAKFKSLPNNGVLDLSKMKAIADDHKYVVGQGILIWERLKALWEMEKMLVYQHFLLFPQCFKKTSFRG